MVAGGFVRIDVPGALALQPELLYVQKGAKKIPEVSIPEIQSIVYDVDYIELPLLVKGQLPIGGPHFSPSLLAGPTVGINIASDVDAKWLAQGARVDLSSPKPVELGLSVGAGGDIPLDVGTLSADVRYQLGLTDAFEGSDTFVRNQGIVLTAGFSF
jgi:hypothetical protein